MKLEDFIPFVSAELPSCPSQLIINETLLKAIDFCTKTHAWTETQDATPLIDSVSDYDVDVPPGARLVTVKSVKIDGRKLDPVTEAWLESYEQSYATARAVAPVQYNAPFQRDIITVYPTPSSPTQSIVITGVYTPTITSTTIPDFIVNEYLEAFSAGVKSALMLKAGQQWSNPQQGVMYARDYEIGRNNARIEVLHDRVKSSLTVRPVRFG